MMVFTEPQIFLFLAKS